MIRSASLSGCGTFRYDLGRVWDPGNPRRVLWVMLNPSTADADVDDPAIRRCVAFSKREGAGGLTVTNLFAFRASNPAALVDASDPVGPENDAPLVLFREAVS